MPFLKIGRMPEFDLTGISVTNDGTCVVNDDDTCDAAIRSDISMASYCVGSTSSISASPNTTDAAVVLRTGCRVYSLRTVVAAVDVVDSSIGNGFRALKPIELFGIVSNFDESVSKIDEIFLIFVDWSNLAASKTMSGRWLCCGRPFVGLSLIQACNVSLKTFWTPCDSPSSSPVCFVCTGNKDGCVHVATDVSTTSFGGGINDDDVIVSSSSY